MLDFKENADTVDRIRIFDEGDGWSIDGMNTETEEYTKAVWTYETREQALSAEHEFVRALREYFGVTVSTTYELKVEEEMRYRKLEALAARTPPWEPIPGSLPVEYRDTL